MPLSKSQVNKIIENRRRGLYHTKDTFDESKLCARQMEPTDVCYTLIRHMGFFNVYNKREFLTQLKEFKAKSVVLRDCNVFETPINGKTHYLAVFQPADLSDAPMCPLALAHNVMVSGFSYIFQNKSDADLALAYLK
jgi:hypothetical protein